ncbi:DnaD domain protein [Oceanobacillus sp. FSL K6-2867]|uniref:DnaD domain protein n=1 Tax=Oceanobacillus sp. FSL K6-2867 TaxID=2954748 RepID=UPI0030DA76BF
MNVWKEMNAFRDWLLLNEMSSSGIVLWYSLFTIWKKFGCESKFNVPNSTLMKLTGLSKQGLIKARNTLIRHQFIHYENKKGSAPDYQLSSLARSVESSQSHSQSQTTSESLPLLDDLRNRRREGRKIASEKLLVAYEQSFGGLPPIAMQSLHDWSEELEEEIILEAIELAMKQGGRMFSNVEEILEQWKGAGLKNTGEVRNYIKQPKSQNTVPFKKRTKKEKNTMLFDEPRREGESG